jgi:hypothetical protein
MKERLDQLEAGDEIVVWKALEANDDGTEKYRVLVHFQTRPKRTDRPANEPHSPVREQQAGPPPAAAPVYSDRIDTERLVAWRAKVKETLDPDEFHDLGLALSQSGFDFDGVSEIEWVDHVRPLVQGIINRRDT